MSLLYFHVWLCLQIFILYKNFLIPWWTLHSFYPSNISAREAQMFLPNIISNDYPTGPRTEVAKMLKRCFDSRRQQILSRWVVLDKNGKAISHFYGDKLIWQSWQRNQIQTKMFITRLWKLKHSNRFNKHWPFFHMSLLYRKYCSSDLFH